MPVNVDEIVSNIQPEPESDTAAGAASEPEWRRASDLRSLLVCTRKDRHRTAADGFDD